MLRAERVGPDLLLTISQSTWAPPAQSEFGWRALPGGLDVRRMPNPTTSEYTRGALYGLAAVCIWAGFIVVSRLGVRTTLTPWDVVAIRFAVAGSLLLPYAMRKAWRSNASDGSE
jgi:drug/metabolite transporter (DMT)-like permease